MRKLMMKFSKRFKFDEKGFTLIELLVVISILGVLAAIAVSNIIGMTDTSNITAANVEMATVQTAVRAAMTDAGQAIVTPNSFGNGADFTVTTSYKVGNYIQGGADAIKGVYHIDNLGVVTATDRGSWPAIVAVQDGRFVKAP